MRRSLAFALAALAIACAPAAARGVNKGDLTLTDLQVRATLGVNPNTAGYLVIANKGGADALIGASCTCAREVQLHVMEHAGGVMRMNRVSDLAIPANGRLALQPGQAAHLMVMGTKGALKAGTDVDMTLRFRRAGTVTTKFHVVAAAGAAADHGKH